ncbi:MAG TPA: HNH endonuclease signature motif containing protein [Candidatus Limnocylindria bacterium]|nr:HNH endonuclease signature motif containing protein [Candidatus Limnocylindria bacterium]
MRRDPEKAREGMRRWRKRHPQEHNAEVRGYYRRHRERIVRRSVEYHRSHPEIGRTVNAPRRAQAAGGGGSHTTGEWLALCAECGGRCAYCGGPGPLHRDHRLPLSRGGTNDIANIAPACASCNMRKHKMTDREWMIRLLNERLASPEFVVVDWWGRDQIQLVS